MKAAFTNGIKRADHDLCWTDGKWNFKNHKCSPSERHWEETLRACMLRGGGPERRNR
jgi:hypothetical protein